MVNETKFEACVDVFEDNDYTVVSTDSSLDIVSVRLDPRKSVTSYQPTRRLLELGVVIVKIRKTDSAEYELMFSEIEHDGTTTIEVEQTETVDPAVVGKSYPDNVTIEATWTEETERDSFTLK